MKLCMMDEWLRKQLVYYNIWVLFDNALVLDRILTSISNKSLFLGIIQNAQVEKYAYILMCENIE